jgi:hypothetical protein
VPTPQLASSPAHPPRHHDLACFRRTWQRKRSTSGRLLMRKSGLWCAQQAAPAVALCLRQRKGDSIVPPNYAPLCARDNKDALLHDVLFSVLTACSPPAQLYLKAHSCGFRAPQGERRPHNTQRMGAQPCGDLQVRTLRALFRQGPWLELGTANETCAEIGLQTRRLRLSVPAARIAARQQRSTIL